MIVAEPAEKFKGKYYCNLNYYPGLLSPVVAAFLPCFLQLVTPLFRLPAVLPVTPLRVAQVFFRFVDAPLAFVVTISRPHRRGTPEHQ